MAVRTALLNWNNINLDSDFSKYIESRSQQWVIKWLELTNTSVAPWMAWVLCTRTNWETIMVFVENTASLELPSGDWYIVITVPQAMIDDWTDNPADWTWIATINKVSSLPSENCLLLWQVSSGTLVDKRPILKKFEDIATFYGVSWWSNNNYTLDLPFTVQYQLWKWYIFYASFANTWTATLNINGMWAKTIYKQHDEPLLKDDIEQWQMVHVIYDWTAFQMVSMPANIAISDDTYGDWSDWNLTISSNCVMCAKTYNFNNLTINSWVRLSFCWNWFPYIKVKNKFCNMGTIDLHSDFINFVCYFDRVSSSLNFNFPWYNCSLQFNAWWVWWNNCANKWWDAFSTCRWTHAGGANCQPWCPWWNGFWGWWWGWWNWNTGSAGTCNWTNCWNWWAGWNGDYGWWGGGWYGDFGNGGNWWWGYVKWWTWWNGGRYGNGWNWWNGLCSCGRAWSGGNWWAWYCWWNWWSGAWWRCTTSGSGGNGGDWIIKWWNGWNGWSRYCCTANWWPGGNGGNALAWNYSLAIYAVNFYNNCIDWIWWQGGNGGNGGSPWLWTQATWCYCGKNGWNGWNGWRWSDIIVGYSCLLAVWTIKNTWWCWWKGGNWSNWVWYWNGWNGWKGGDGYFAWAGGNGWSRWGSYSCNCVHWHWWAGGNGYYWWKGGCAPAVGCWWNGGNWEIAGEWMCWWANGTPWTPWYFRALNCKILPLT